jgi:glycosyltransferase involved in cell wall biosynthesis
VHNHRFYCTNGLALRDQKICKDCRSNTIPWKALLHNCNQDWKKTAYHTLAIGQLHRNQLLQSSIHRFIAPSPYVKAELQAWGLEAEKITTLIHPIAPHLEPSENTPENKMEKIDIFYAGRLSPEKGIEEIIQMAMQAPDLQFAIAGNGPLLARVQYMKRKIRNLKLFSDLPRAQMITLLSRSRLAIAPSLCNETLSQFALEAMCLGKPVVVGNAESTHWLTQNPFFAFSADPQNISAFLQTARQALNSSVNQEKVQALRIQLGNERYQNELKNIVKDLLGQ